MAAKTPCLGTEFDKRVEHDGYELYRCTTCGRVARTTRRHRQADKNTRSHDKTMAILWDHAEEAS
ncbi:MAG: hypothetical protein HOV97_05820 [Nonomuraea sp.]|nr:hypothetical protein [Nonomuraea sp.]